jgi:DNA-binding NarL/FixJ family response regulator
MGTFRCKSLLLGLFIAVSSGAYANAPHRSLVHSVIAKRAVHAEHKHFGSELVESLLGKSKESAAQSGLLKDQTEHETEVLAAREGLSNKEIGECLFISPRTMDTHRTDLMKKRYTHNIAGLVRTTTKGSLVK